MNGGAAIVGVIVGVSERPEVKRSIGFFKDTASCPSRLKEGCKNRCDEDDACKSR